MTSSAVRVLFALAVVVAVVGTIGVVSADVNATTTDEEYGHATDVVEHANGIAHVGDDVVETIHEHVRPHDRGERHSGHAHGEHHGPHAHGEHHDSHEHGEHHGPHAHGEYNDSHEHGEHHDSHEHGEHHDSHEHGEYNDSHEHGEHHDSHEHGEHHEEREDRGGYHGDRRSNRGHC